jgi:hypothetical protein
MGYSTSIDMASALQPQTILALDFEEEPLAPQWGAPLRLRIPCACRKLNPAISVMRSAQDWATKNVSGAIDGARDRCVFLQG